jgi:hypothetical protein
VAKEATIAVRFKIPDFIKNSKSRLKIENPNEANSWLANLKCHISVTIAFSFIQGLY